MLIRQRRFAALQLPRLPRHRRRQFAGRLKFHLIMLDKLERRGHVHPVWQSPFGFAESLTAANEVRFAPVVALTQIFYEIRFGYRNLDDSRQEEVRTHLRQLDAALSRRT